MLPLNPRQPIILFESLKPGLFKRRPVFLPENVNHRIMLPAPVHRHLLPGIRCPSRPSPVLQLAEIPPHHELTPRKTPAGAYYGRLLPSGAELARREEREYEPASVFLEHICSGKTGISTYVGMRVVLLFSPGA